MTTELKADIRNLNASVEEILRLIRDRNSGSNQCDSVGQAQFIAAIRGIHQWYSGNRIKS